MRKIVLVILREPIDGEQIFFFGSVVAVYDMLGKEQIGIACPSLRAALRRGGGTYRNKKCFIKVGALVAHPKSK